MIHYSLLSSKNVFMGLVAYNSVYICDMSSGILLHKIPLFWYLGVYRTPKIPKCIFEKPYAGLATNC